MLGKPLVSFASANVDQLVVTIMPDSSSVDPAGLLISLPVGGFLVPEPPTAAPLVTGLALLAARGARRRRGSACSNR